ncbi:RICIN domain-containing protein [Nonomuraea turkmeniaca]|uniref:RICIN domain-containing protein n=2 Tax=Nonomuraea turkmeniaca TaxID=103838 RepID=A0A5S4FJ08_9ACTN|nr:RICIN domain-containing protein [Nonomuraea turkmeniaca]
MLTATAPSASAAPAIPDSFTIRPKAATSLCVKAPAHPASGSGEANGSVVLLEFCGSSWMPTTKTWTANRVSGTTDLYRIRRQWTNLCLEIGGWANHDAATALTWTCHSGANQTWRLRWDGGGWWEFRNEASLRCLDVRVHRAWTSLNQWGCHGGGEQQWVLIAA